MTTFTMLWLAATLGENSKLSVVHNIRPPNSIKAVNISFMFVIMQRHNDFILFLSTLHPKVLLCFNKKEISKITILQSLKSE